MLKTLIAGVLAASLFVPTRAQALENQDLLALVAMPLAVAAVSQMTDVPMNELMNVVTLLNNAAVPPPQFIEVVRYVPVALVADDTQPDFVDFLRAREQQGINGIALVNSIQDQYRVYGLRDIDFNRPAVTVINVDADYIPPIVRTRVEEAHHHPHGGPPGQLKKELGLQTGAEVVHGEKPGKSGKVRDEHAHVPPAGEIRHEKTQREKAHGKPAHAGKPAHHGKPSASFRNETVPERAPSPEHGTAFANGGGHGSGKAAGGHGAAMHGGGTHGEGHGKGRGKG